MPVSQVLRVSLAFVIVSGFWMSNMTLAQDLHEDFNRLLDDFTLTIESPDALLLSQLYATQEALLDEHQELKRAHDRLAAEVTDLQAQLDQSQESGTELTPHTADLENQVESLRQGLSMMNTLLSKGREERHDLQAQLSEARAALANQSDPEDTTQLEAKTLRLTEELQQANTRISSLQTEKEVLEREQAKQQEQARYAESVQQFIKEQRNTLLRDFRALQEEHQALQDRATELQVELAARPQQTTTQVTCQVASQPVPSTNENNADDADDVGDVNACTDTLSQELIDARIYLKQQQTQIEALNQERQAQNDTIARLTTERNDALARLQARQTQLEQAQTQLAQAREQATSIIEGTSLETPQAATVTPPRDITPASAPSQDTIKTDDSASLSTETPSPATLDQAKQRAAAAFSAYQEAFYSSSPDSEQIGALLEVFTRAQEDVARLMGVDTYRIASGDSLSHIAARHLDNGERYPEIVELNSYFLENPRVLQPGMLLLLP